MLGRFGGRWRGGRQGRIGGGEGPANIMTIKSSSNVVVVIVIDRGDEDDDQGEFNGEANSSPQCSRADDADDDDADDDNADDDKGIPK
jgi:hypothetical protein